MLRLFPTARREDPEDVSWALSTAEAMWNRGDHTESIKWIRRAAEAASECEKDGRALELAKAAAELASLPAGGASQVVVPKAPTAPAAPPVTMKNPPPPPAGTPPAVPKRPTSPPPPPVPEGARAPTAAKVAQPPAPAKQGPPSTRGARRKAVSHSGEESKTSKSARLVRGDTETTSEVEVPIVPISKQRRAEAEAAAIELADVGYTAMSPNPLFQRNRLTPQSATQLQAPLAVDSLTVDIDAWPTQSVEGETDGLTTERTRLAVPAYEERARDASGSASQKPRSGADRGPVKACQAVRVIVWRGADGTLRVAPSGTAVSAVTVDAMLVATEPGADLLAWLGQK